MLWARGAGRGPFRWPMLALAALLVAGAAHARDAAAGRLKAQVCAVCHGPLGVSTTPDAPNLAAQPAIYLAAQLQAYRSGARKHEVMAVLAKALTDDDISDLAAWFASIRIEAQAP
ncbi:MAG TPA: c-type cytochrome [Rubrivivax sp.]